MRPIKRSEVEQLRLFDRILENGRFESRCYVKARGMWFKDTRFQASDARAKAYNREAIIKDFLASQPIYQRCDEPCG
jgi:hypothetical protein